MVHVHQCSQCQFARGWIPLFPMFSHYSLMICDYFLYDPPPKSIQSSPISRLPNGPNLLADLAISLHIAWGHGASAVVTMAFNTQSWSSVTTGWFGPPEWWPKITLLPISTQPVYFPKNVVLKSLQGIPMISVPKRLQLFQTLSLATAQFWVWPGILTLQSKSHFCLTVIIRSSRVNGQTVDMY